MMAGFESQLTSNTALRLVWVDRSWQDLWDDSLRAVEFEGEVSDSNLVACLGPSGREGVVHAQSGESACRHVGGLGKC